MNNFNEAWNKSKVLSEPDLAQVLSTVCLRLDVEDAPLPEVLQLLLDAADRDVVARLLVLHQPGQRLRAEDGLLLPQLRGLGLHSAPGPGPLARGRLDPGQLGLGSLDLPHELVKHLVVAHLRGL